ncbi:MAG TPA: hypothetical protein VFA06_03000 [Actinocrinis sp.]|uniref:hypothetical protein n=1 Tax=Actinocrinis sp. TaxID=1920516 RepID=UPI002D3B93DC|nr:hypothetical protein [Actinocrinis sp.]HZU54816.1 hypothetical protein [Actinocrinis sp.]
MSTETIRKSVPLNAAEQAALSEARIDGTPVHDALAELVGPDATRSEAATLQALLHLGLRAVKERVDEHGYAALAAARTEEDWAFHRAMRARRRVRGAEGE